MNRYLLVIIVISVSILTAFANVTYAGTQKAAEVLQEHSEMDTKQNASTLSGKVAETMDSGGYTYINIEKKGKKTWVAVPQMKVTVGQSISVEPGMVMQNFKSKTLNRTFETIIFSPGIAGQAGDDAAAAGHKKASVSPSKPVKVEKASGPNAYTVAELFREREKLAGKSIVIRGQVVKFSSNIMGKNWIHIQDGSGDSSAGTNDILITSQDVASAGDIITVQGTLNKDKDFGSGYRYSVIVEDASIKK